MDFGPRCIHRVCGLALGQLWLTSAHGQESRIFFQRQADPWVYSVAPDGSGLTQVAEGKCELISPDGRSLLVREGNALAVVAIDGSGVTALGEDVGSSPTWSSYGQQVLFHRRGNIYMAKADGSGESLLVRGGRKAWWVPTDPPTVYFTRRKPESMDAYDLLSIRVGTKEVRIVQELIHIPYSSRQPFSPDGSRLLASDCADGASCVKILDLASGTIEQVGPTGRMGAQNPVWSPEGQRILYNIYDGMGGMSVADLEAGTVTEVVPGHREAAPGGGAWSPDGSRIAYHVTDWAAETPSQLYIVNADGTGARWLTEGQWPVWTPSAPIGLGTDAGIRDSSWGETKQDTR